MVSESSDAPVLAALLEDALASGDRLQVGTRAERLVTAAGEDDRTHAGIFVSGGDRIADKHAHVVVDGVACLRAVDLDDEGVPGPLNAYLARPTSPGHGCSIHSDVQTFRSDVQSSSKIVALAWPPPSHMVCSP
jgi:hypothetical protein